MLHAGVGKKADLASALRDCSLREEEEKQQLKYDRRNIIKCRGKERTSFFRSAFGRE